MLSMIYVKLKTKDRLSATRFSLTGADSSPRIPTGRPVRRAAKRKTLYYNPSYG
jgi:hypothetical protein